MLLLPFDAGVPDNYVLHVKDNASAPVEAGWEDFPLAAFLGIRPEPPTSQIKSTTLWFRGTEVPAANGFHAVLAFPEVADDARKGARPPEGPDEPPKQRRTVVSATRIDTPPESLAEHDISVWRGGQVTHAMMVLNTYLESITKETSNLAVGPVLPTDFPPLLFGYRRELPNSLQPGASPYADHFCFVLHEYLPWVTEELTWEHAQVAEQRSRGPLPFANAEAYLREAERAELQENSRHAIIDACTAIELAVSAAMRTYGPLAGYHEAKLSNILDGAFASRVKDHFAPLVGFSGDVAQASDVLGIWWRDGYARRNAVVHRGEFALRLHANEAVTAARDLLRETVANIAVDQRFAAIPPS